MHDACTLARITDKNIINFINKCIANVYYLLRRFFSITRGTFLFSIAQKILFVFFSILFFLFWFFFKLNLAQIGVVMPIGKLIMSTKVTADRCWNWLWYRIVSFRYRYSNRYRLRLRCAALMDMSKVIYFQSHIYQFCLLSHLCLCWVCFVNE